MSHLYPQIRHPYYIVCQPYTRKSAGVKAIYLLCHYLNLRGYSAYLVLRPQVDLDTISEINSDLLMPVLSTPIFKRHLQKGQLPITFYTETAEGNPFCAPCVVRFYGNFPELLGGGPVSHDELNFGYSKILAEAIGAPDNVLYIPTVDTTLFHPAESKQERKGTCFYAGKYQEAHQGTLFEITKNSMEISRGKNSQTPEQIAHLFRTSELFYVYENTALITEAILCGCPTVVLPNPYMTKPIAGAEIGNDGLAWGTDPAEIERARQTVHQGWSRYLEGIDLFHAHLSAFIEKTQAYARQIYGPEDAS